MSPLILVFIYCLDCDRDHRQTVPGACNQHVHLIFEPFALDLPHKVKVFLPECPQAGLGILQPFPIQQEEQYAREPVSRPAFGRHIIQAEIPAPKVQRPCPLFQLLRQMNAVRHGVLPVCISRNDAADPLQILLNPFVSGLQRHALSVVHVVVQYCNPLIDLFNLPEYTLVLFAGAVIHHHDVPETTLHQPPDISRQTLIRLQGGDQDDRLLQRFSCALPLFLNHAVFPSRLFLSISSGSPKTARTPADSRFIIPDFSRVSNIDAPVSVIV